LLKLQFKKETFASTFLENGTTEVTNNSESEFEVGQTLYVVEESTLTPAPVGSHKTREGLIITLDEESTIISIATETVETEEVEEKTEVEMTIAEDAQGMKLESPTFDVGEDVFVVKEDGTKQPAPNGEHEVILKDESGNENKIRIQVEDGKIIQRENVESSEETMSSKFSQDLNDIKGAMTELLSVVNEMNGKFKTEINALKTEFSEFKKSPERKSVEEFKSIGQSFDDFKLDVIKSMRGGMKR
jgi:hypothetical protein